jgi:hypothetical protein
MKKLFVLVICVLLIGGNMQLGNLLHKIASNQPLTMIERQAIREMGNNIQSHDAVSSGWIGSSGKIG